MPVRTSCPVCRGACEIASGDPEMSIRTLRPPPKPPDDRDTPSILISCPQCFETGVVTKKSALGVTYDQVCDLCVGNKVVSAELVLDWKRKLARKIPPPIPLKRKQ